MLFFLCFRPTIKSQDGSPVDPLSEPSADPLFDSTSQKLFFIVISASLRFRLSRIKVSGHSQTHTGKGRLEGQYHRRQGRSIINLERHSSCSQHSYAVTPQDVYAVTPQDVMRVSFTLQSAAALVGGLVARAIRNAIRAHRFARIIRNWNPYFCGASGQFARITWISGWHESPDPRESCESIRANHATKVGGNSAHDVWAWSS